MSKIFRAVILGAPGSGKGTISARIMRDFGLKHVSSGDFLRAEIMNLKLKGAGTTESPVYKSEAALKAKDFIERGQLVPDNLMVKLILNQLSHMTTISWLLDGFPRTATQAKALQETHNVDVAISLDIPFPVLSQRLGGRWVHPASGRTYNLDWEPPKTPGKDDETGETLIQRDDDKPETIRTRLHTYSQQMEGILDFYRNLGILEVFEGTETNQIWPHVHTFLQSKISN